jgi:LysM repeat protein
MVSPLPALAAQVTVRPGETLSDIATRHNVSVSTLMKVNGISDPDLVEAGRTLRVPGTAAPARPSASGSITVGAGETLSEIAERHGMSVSRLMQLNGLGRADHIEAGQSLKVSAPAIAAPPASARTAYNPKASEHVVRPGESLSGIADGYGVPLSRLIALNSISDPNHVEYGTRLQLKPAATTTKSPAPKPAAVAPRPVAAVSKPVSKPVAKPVVTATRPTTTPATTATPITTPVAAARPTMAATKPIVTATPTAAASVTPRPTRSQTTIASAPRPATTAASPGGKPDWRNYGPLQVDWANWQPMGGSMVAPTLNAQGESLYLAVNCSARKINATSQAGQWKSWDDPRSDFEQQLVSDLCKARGG